MLKASRHFTIDEISCRANGELVVPRSGPQRHCFEQTLRDADNIRDDFGYGLVCLSGYRTLTHNVRIGGALRSMHRILALDLRPSYADFPDPMQFELALERLYQLMLARFAGIGRYKTFIHGDRRDLLGRPPARWTDLDWVPKDAREGA